MRASIPFSRATPNLLIDCLSDPERLSELDAGEWDRLLRQARESQMLASLWELLGRLGAHERAPAPVREHLRGAYLVTQRRAAALDWELECLRSELPRLEGARPVLLKGVAYLAAGLPHARGRFSADIDILVPRSELDRVERLLSWSGWSTGSLTPYDERYYREWMHQLPPLQHRRRRSTLDLHHNILPDTARQRPDPQRLIGQSRGLDGDPVFGLLSPAHMVIHSAVHLFADSEWDKAARDFYDLDQLMRYYASIEGAGFWRQLAEETAVTRQGRAMFYALRYCQLWLKTPVPAEALEILQQWAPNRAVLAVMDRVFFYATISKAAGPSPRLTTACRALLLVRSHYLKMPPLLLARHLFYKAFLARDTDEERQG